MYAQAMMLAFAEACDDTNTSATISCNGTCLDARRRDGRWMLTSDDDWQVWVRLWLDHAEDATSDEVGAVIQAVWMEYDKFDQKPPLTVTASLGKLDVMYLTYDPPANTWTIQTSRNNAPSIARMLVESCPGSRVVASCIAEVLTLDACSL